MLVVAVWVPSTRADDIPWRTDYNAARKEAEEKGLPLFVEVGTEACFYCRKLESGPFRDPTIRKLLEKEFIPLKIDANREPMLARALKVNLYPTMLLAGHDGKIHAFLEGYMDSERIQGSLTTVIAATTAAYAKELQDAKLAFATADYARGIEMLKTTIANTTAKPLASKAKEVLEPIERKAALKLAQARALEAAGDFNALTDALAEVASTFRGTRAASEADEMLANLGDSPDRREAEATARRQQHAKDLLSLARIEFRLTKYSQCLQHCDELATQFPDTAEARTASAIALDIQTDPERLAVAEAQLKERSAAMNMALAEAWVRKGQLREAAGCLERVVQLLPASRLGEEAKARLTTLGNPTDTYPTGYRKP